VIVLGLLDTYYDEQVKPPECSASLKRVMRVLAKVSALKTHILIADVDVGDNAPVGKKLLFPLVLREAGNAMLLSHDGTRFTLGPGRSAARITSTNTPEHTTHLNIRHGTQ